MVNAKTWNPAQIDQAIRRLEGIIRSGSYNPAELNQLLNQLGEPGYINTWNPAELDQKLRTLLLDLLTWKTLNGNPIQLRTNNGGLVQSCEVTFSPIQSGSGDPSPTNIRPISGRYSLVLNQCGKNLCPIEYLGGTGSSNTFTLKAGSYSLSFRLLGTAKYSTSEISVRDGVSLNVPIKVSGHSVGERLSNTFTLTSDTTVYLFNSNVNTDSNSKSCDQIQIELGSVSQYEEYITPTTHTATFSDTVYNGSYEFVSGKGTSNYVMVDLGDLDYSYVSENAYFYAIVPNIYVPSQSSERNKGLLSSQYRLAAGTSANNMTNGEMLRASGRVYLKNTDYTDAETFKTAMSGVQLCYELATPTEITLTPEDIELLSGNNVLWTDGDSIEITYKKLLLPSDVEELSKNKKIKEKPKTTRSKKKKEE